MRVVRKYGFILLLIMSISNFAMAQGECPPGVDEAISALNEICLSTGRNQACYGNGQIIAVPASSATIEFDVPGDSANVDDIQILTLSPYEASLNDWGVALLVLQANLPNTLPGQNVTMLVFGDVSLSNDSGAYYFTSGIGTPTCHQAPDGILIQTPEGVGEVNLTMNGINITLGSTAYLGTLEEDILTFALLEGNASLSIEGSEVVLEGEQFTTIALDEDGNAIGEFAEPEALENLELPELPVSLLPENPDEHDSVDVSGDVIIPASGEWLSTISLFNFEGNCPAMFDEDNVRQMLTSFGFSDTVTQEFSFDANEFDINDLFDTSEFTNAGIGATYSNPEPNVHVIDFSIPENEGSFSYVWRIVSPDRVEGEIIQNLVIPDLADCTITTTFLLERQE